VMSISVLLQVLSQKQFLKDTPNRQKAPPLGGYG